MTADELERWLADPDVPQRAKLEQLQNMVTVIRALDDATFVRVVRAIKKRLGSPKLADEVAALVHAASVDRETRPIEAPRGEPAPVPWVGSADLDPAAHPIEAAIAADPEARGPYGVLGDYWTQAGDPRGELIAIGTALAKNPTHKAMTKAWAQWHQAHVRALWGEHGMTPYLVRDADWYMGFLRACTVVADHRADMPGLLAALLDEPGPGRFIQRLAITGPFGLASVLARRPRPTLHTLALGEPGNTSGDLSAVWPALVGLRALRLEGNTAALGALQLPRLASFTFDFTFSEGGIEFLAPLWAGEGLPALRELAITNCEHTDALCEALVASPLAGQLTALDFGSGTMSDAGAQALLAQREKLARVERWNFELNYLSAEACEQLTTTLPGTLLLGDQREGAEDRRHGADWE